MKRLIALLGCMLFVACLSAQPVFVPERDITKVGELLFQTPKTFVLGFTNKGDKPLQVLRVEPSCGCTAVEFSDKEIAPKERGEIHITFDAKMLGAFYKEVEIHTNVGPEPYYMALQGVVVREIQDYGTDYPIDLGNVRLVSNSVEFDDVNKGDSPVHVIRVLNTDRTPYRPELMHLPPYLTATYLPESIPGGKSGEIRLKLNSDKLYQLGLNQTVVYLARYMGDRIGEENEIVVSAVLLPDFSQLTPDQIANAPKLVLSTQELKFAGSGKKYLGKKYLDKVKRKPSQSLTVSNMGKTTLNIKKLQVFSRALSVSLSDRTIEPGKSAKLKVTVNEKYLKRSKVRPRVLLISDDPQQSKVLINVQVAEE